MEVDTRRIYIEIDDARELLKLIRKNKSKSQLVLDCLITLFSSNAVIVSCFPMHEQLTDYFVKLKESKGELESYELDLLTININACIRDMESKLRSYEN